MQKASDIMTTPVISIKAEQTLQDAIGLLAKNKLSGLPVVDEENMVIGIISDTDIIGYSQRLKVMPLTNLSGWISPHTEITELATMRKGFENLNYTRVGDIMTKKVHMAREDEPVNNVAGLMSRRRINRVPIIDAEGKLKGIITRADIVRCMADI